MVPYYGHHSSKMYIRGKPIRFGFKLWVLASSDGYPFKIDVYTGKFDSSNVPLGEKVITNLLNSVQHPLRHTVYFDNFFSSYKLMAMLADQKFRATGTI